MKAEMNKSAIDELNDYLSPDDSILGPLISQDTLESSHVKANKKAEKKLNINNSILLDIITDQTKSKFIWQCVCAGLGVFIVLAGFMYFNLYKSNENLEEKVFDYAKLETKFAESKAENDRLKSEVFEANNELKATKSELNKNKTEITKLQEELDSLSKELRDLQDRNAEVAKILSGRLQKLSK